MFQIVVCFKITDDYDELTSADWDVRDENGFPKTDFVKRILGCFDEAALENALLLKEEIQACGGEAAVCAVTINPGYSQHILNSMAAVGIDRIVCMHTQGCLDFCPEATAQILASFLAQTDPDLILCGQQAAPGGSGKVPLLLAQILNLPLKPAVTKLHWNTSFVSADCEYTNAYIRYNLNKGTVCVIGNAERSYLRIPTLREKLKAKHFQPEEKTVESAVPPNVLSFAKVCRERDCKMEDNPLAIAREVCMQLDKERAAQ